MKKLAIIVLVAATALAGCKKKEKGKPDLPPAAGEGAKPLPDIPDLTKPDPGTGTGTGSAAAEDSAVTGTLEPREQVTVGPKASGTITQITVDEGSVVKKGDLLFRLDTSNAALMRKQAMTQLSAAKLQLKTAQREYDRIKGLVAQNALPQQQLDQLEAQVEGAQVQIAAAQNSIAMANKQISDATTRAPLGGIVIKKLMNVGEYATMMPPSPVVILQDQSALELKFKLPEKTLATLHQGDPVTVKIASLGIERGAKVAQISPMVDPMTRTIELTAILDNCDGALKPGLAAQVQLGAPTGGAALSDGSCAKPAPKKPAAAKPAKPIQKKGKPS